MELVGFNLTKLRAERFSMNFKDLKIETSINIDNIEENKIIPKKEGINFLNVTFNYIIDYSKKIAKIELGGRLILSVDSKLSKEILKKWKKKELKEEIKLSIFNGILIKANIKAVQIEDELGLPTHFRFPSLKISKKE